MTRISTGLILLLGTLQAAAAGMPMNMSGPAPAAVGTYEIETYYNGTYGSGTNTNGFNVQFKQGINPLTHLGLSATKTGLGGFGLTWSIRSRIAYARKKTNSPAYTIDASLGNPNAWTLRHILQWPKKKNSNSILRMNIDNNFSTAAGATSLDIAVGALIFDKKKKSNMKSVELFVNNLGGALNTQVEILGGISQKLKGHPGKIGCRLGLQINTGTGGNTNFLATAGYIVRHVPKKPKPPVRRRRRRIRRRKK